MADEDIKTYQPQWEERKASKRRHRHHHHHASFHSDKLTNGWGGWMKMQDKQAYYGLMFIVLAVLAFGGYKLTRLVVEEIRSLPMDDPGTEVKVDELNIRKVDRQDALLLGDSLAQTYNIDSSEVRRVQTEIHMHHVYRPPRRENKWYITQREWKDIWRNIQRWKQSNINDKRLDEQQSEKQATEERKE